MNVTFVCTGNTCRSPMAEYYLKSKGIKNLNVCSRGFSEGEKANQNSIAVMQELGIDITAHISKAISKEDIKNSDAIFCMTESHRQLLLSFGADCNKTFVLNSGISDPFGCDTATYRSCRDMIICAVDALIDDGFFCDVEICSATEHEIKDIAKIEKECFSTPWSENAVDESFKAGTCFYVAKIGSNVVGYMGLSKIVGEGYVTNVAVLPPFRRRGIGKKILEYVLDTSKDELEFISLEVRVSNTAAISLYEYFGFETVGRRKNFYTSPREDALIMTKKFI